MTSPGRDHYKRCKQTNRRALAIVVIATIIATATALTAPPVVAAAWVAQIATIVGALVWQSRTLHKITTEMIGYMRRPPGSHRR